jgi:hypothetical protein
MTLVRRVAALETSLTPTQLVLRWLDEATAVSGVRTALRGKRPEVIYAAISSALRETVFRFALVMRILVTTHELLERESLIEAALSAHIALLTSEGRAQRRLDATYLERFATRRDLLTFRVAELRAAQKARALVSRRDTSPATPRSSLTR